MTIFTGFSPFVVTSFSKYLKSYIDTSTRVLFGGELSIKSEERKILGLLISASTTQLTLQMTDLRIYLRLYIKICFLYRIMDVINFVFLIKPYQ